MYRPQPKKNEGDFADLKDRLSLSVNQGQAQSSTQDNP